MSHKYSAMIQQRQKFMNKHTNIGSDVRCVANKTSNFLCLFVGL